MIFIDSIINSKLYQDLLEVPQEIHIPLVEYIPTPLAFSYEDFYFFYSPKINKRLNDIHSISNVLLDLHSNWYVKHKKLLCLSGNFSNGPKSGKIVYHFFVKKIYGPFPPREKFLGERKDDL